MIALLQAAAMIVPMPAPAPAPAPIIVTINLEARLTLRREAVLPPQDCRSPIHVAVAIENAGRVRSHLRLNVDPALATLEGDDDPLTGAPAERRSFRLTLRTPADTLLSVTSDVGPATADIGGRSRIGLPIRCRD